MTGPTPGSVSRSDAVAVLRSITADSPPAAPDVALDAPLSGGVEALTTICSPSTT